MIPVSAVARNNKSWQQNRFLNWGFGCGFCVMCLTSLGDPHVTLFRYYPLKVTRGFTCLPFAAGHNYLCTLWWETCKEKVWVWLWSAPTWNQRLIFGVWTNKAILTLIAKPKPGKRVIVLVKEEMSVNEAKYTQTSNLQLRPSVQSTFFSILECLSWAKGEDSYYFVCLNVSFKNGYF